MRKEILVKTAALAIAASLFMPGAARAGEGRGDRGGNGGVSIVCRDSAGSITRVQVLDVAEAGSSIPESDDAPEAIVHRALDRLRDAGLGWAEGAIWARIQEISRRTRIVSNEYSLDFTRDANTWLVSRAACRQEQLAVYQRGTRELLIREELYRRLSPVNLAALALHEAVYSLETERLAPGERDGTSDRARAFVRALLSPGSTAQDLGHDLNFRVEERDDVSWSLARALALGSARPLRCAGHCPARELEGEYLLASATTGIQCAPAFALALGKESIRVTHPIVRELESRPSERDEAEYGLGEELTAPSSDGLRVIKHEAGGAADGPLRLSTTVKRYLCGGTSAKEVARCGRPIIRWTLPSVEATRTMELAPGSDGRLVTKVSGSSHGTCVYERRER